MSPNELAEIYEQLKGLRRRVELSDDSLEQRVGPDEDEELKRRRLQCMVELGIFGSGVLGTVVLDRLEELTGKFAETDQFTCLVRMLDIRTLADRVFGDEKKAEIWLNRPNTSFSGQKPVDLLKDELGAAVVRETLEQIDSGIFA